MPLTRNQIVIIGAGILVVVVIGSLFFFGGSDTQKPPEVVLTFFGTSAERVMGNLINSYKSLRPNVKINYIQFPAANYERELINAIAAGRGPDIFEIGDTWLPKHGDKMMPASASQFPVTALDLFPQAVSQAFEANGAVYALPLTLDTLALFYNKDIFDAQGIVFPPATWEEFQKIIPTLREMDGAGRITRPAAAIGGSEASVLHAIEILNLLFLQTGAPSIIEGGEIRFGDKGLEALNFYLNFSNSLSAAYTWDERLGSSFDNFADGNVAMMFGFAEDLPFLKERAPFLNIGIAATPQVQKNQTVSSARFAGMAVSRSSRASSWAWDFVIQAATNEALAEPVAIATGQSPALRSLIGARLGDKEKAVFARQALTARLWLEPDPTEVRQILSRAIKDVLSGKLSSRQALTQAEEGINLLR